MGKTYFYRQYYKTSGTFIGLYLFLGIKNIHFFGRKKDIDVYRRLQAETVYKGTVVNYLFR